jgi:subtilisin family serine protease
LVRQQVVPDDPILAWGPVTPYGPPLANAAHPWMGGGAQWALKAINPGPAWNQATLQSAVLGAGINVGILDSGVDIRHADLDYAYIWTYDFVEPSGTCTPSQYPDVPQQLYNCDPNRHGTHVAGIALGAANGYGIVGVAPYGRLTSFRMASSIGTYTVANATAAIVQAITQGMHVVNASFGGPLNDPADPTTTEVAALQLAYAYGMTVVAAAGNSGTADVDASLPAGQRTVITVGATRPDSTVANYSSWGAALDVVAPGGGDVTGAPSAYCRNRFGQDGYFASNSGTVLSARSTIGIIDPFAIANAGFISFYAFVPDFDGCLDGTPPGLQRRVAGDWMLASGTSMAAPHVTGIAAGRLGARRRVGRFSGVDQWPDLGVDRGQ